MAVAHGGLRHLRDQRLRVAQEQMHQRPEPGELVLEMLRLHAEAQSGALDHGAAWRRFTAHEEGDAQHALAADDGDFRGRTVREHVQHRDDSRRRG